MDRRMSSLGEDKEKIMSENQEVEINQGFDSAAPISSQPQEERVAEAIPPTVYKNIQIVDESIDSQSYFLGEVPQVNLVDPCAFLPLNSDRLVGLNSMAKKHTGQRGSLAVLLPGSNSDYQWTHRLFEYFYRL